MIKEKVYLPAAVRSQVIMRTQSSSATKERARLCTKGNTVARSITAMNDKKVFVGPQVCIILCQEKVQRLLWE